MPRPASNRHAHRPLNRDRTTRVHIQSPRGNEADADEEPGLIVVVNLEDERTQLALARVRQWPRTDPESQALGDGSARRLLR